MFLLLGALQEDYGIICKMLFLRKAQRISATEKKHFQILYFLMLKNTAFNLLRHLFSLIIYGIPQKTTLRTHHSRPNAANAKGKMAKFIHGPLSFLARKSSWLLAWSWKSCCLRLSLTDLRQGAALWRWALQEHIVKDKPCSEVKAIYKMVSDREKTVAAQQKEQQELVGWVSTERSTRTVTNHTCVPLMSFNRGSSEWPASRLPAWLLLWESLFWTSWAKAASGGVSWSNGFTSCF